MPGSLTSQATRGRSCSANRRSPMRKSARLLPNIGAGRSRRCTSSRQAASAPGAIGSTALRVNAASSSSHSRASAAPRSVNKTWSPPPGWRRLWRGAHHHRHAGTQRPLPRVHRAVSGAAPALGRRSGLHGPQRRAGRRGAAAAGRAGGGDSQLHAAAAAHARAVCGRRVARLVTAAGCAGCAAVILECGAARAGGSGSRIAASHGALDRRVSGD